MTVAAGDPSPLIERLIRIETKLDVTNAAQLDHEGRIRALETDNTPGGHLDHESRIRRLERSVWLAAGAAAAGGGVIGQMIAPLLRK
jgi:hypothetical protein